MTMNDSNNNTGTNGGSGKNSPSDWARLQQEYDARQKSVGKQSRLPGAIGKSTPNIPLIPTKRPK